MFGHNYARCYPQQYIRRGDRIYVRVTQDRRTVLEFSIDRVADYTSLIGEIRYVGRRLEGLANVFIRNHSRGWSEERPMKFYQGMPAPRGVAPRSRMTQRSVRREMLCPWETH